MEELHDERTDANGRRRLIGTSQDVTDRFWRAEAERANRAKDVKYNDNAGHVQVLASVRSNERVEIRMRDDGPGIASGMIDQLFSPFERLGAEFTIALDRAADVRANITLPGEARPSEAVQTAA